MTQLDTNAGAAQRMQIAYVLAKGRIVGVLPRSIIKGVRKMLPNIRKKKPAKSAE